MLDDLIVMSIAMSLCSFSRCWSFVLYFGSRLVSQIEEVWKHFAHTISLHASTLVLINGILALLSSFHNAKLFHFFTRDISITHRKVWHTAQSKRKLATCRAWCFPSLTFKFDWVVCLWAKFEIADAWSSHTLHQVLHYDQIYREKEVGQTRPCCDMTYLVKRN